MSIIAKLITIMGLDNSEFKTKLKESTRQLDTNTRQMSRIAAKNSASLSSTLRGTETAIAGAGAAMQTLGGQANSAFSSMASAASSLIAGGLNPVALAISAVTIGVGLLVKEFSELSEAEKALEDITAKAKDAEEAFKDLQLKFNLGVAGSGVSSLDVDIAVARDKVRELSLLAQQTPDAIIKAFGDRRDYEKALVAARETLLNLEKRKGITQQLLADEKKKSEAAEREQAARDRILNSEREQREEAKRVTDASLKQLDALQKIAESSRDSRRAFEDARAILEDPTLNATVLAAWREYDKAYENYLSAQGKEKEIAKAQLDLAQQKRDEAIELARTEEEQNKKKLEAAQKEADLKAAERKKEASNRQAISDFLNTQNRLYADIQDKLEMADLEFQIKSIGVSGDALRDLETAYGAVQSKILSEGINDLNRQRANLVSLLSVSPNPAVARVFDAQIAAIDKIIARLTLMEAKASPAQDSLVHTINGRVESLKKLREEIDAVDEEVKNFNKSEFDQGKERIDQLFKELETLRQNSVTIEGYANNDEKRDLKSEYISEEEALRIRIVLTDYYNLLRAQELSTHHQQRLSDEIKKSTTMAGGFTSQLELTAYQYDNVGERGAELANSVMTSMESATMSLVDGSKTAKEAFSDMARSILSDLAQMIIKQTMFNAMIGSGLIKKPETGGFAGQNILTSLFGFATGGSFTVGGSGGTDSQLVAFKATPGEMVDVRTPGQASGSKTTVNITNASGEQVRSSKRDQGNDEIIDIVIGKVAEDLDRGGKVARSMQRNFPVRRQGRQA